MTEDNVAIIFLAAFITAIVVTLIFAKIRRMRIEASYPKEWVHVGTAPQKADVALAAIKMIVGDWDWRYGGTIEWVDNIFEDNGRLCWGIVISFNEPRLKIVRLNPSTGEELFVTSTALTHEVLHIWWNKKRPNVASDGNTEFMKKVTDVNEAVKKII